MMDKTRLEKLKELEAVLQNALMVVDCDKLAPIAKQYRETIREIEEMEGLKGNTDEISEILSRRSADGLTGSISKNHS